MADSQVTGSATYEIVRGRLLKDAARLREEAEILDTYRKEVFGSVGYELLQGDKITTPHACVPRDMTELGRERFLFGFNVTFGLIDKTTPADVFAIYRWNPETATFHADPEAADALFQSPGFLENFDRLYRVYGKVAFKKFSEAEGNLFMVFQTGTAESDFAVLKWKLVAGGLEFVDGRAESEFRSRVAPPSHHFSWRSPDRDSFRYGEFPHVSIENRVFVDCIAGDLTIKIEDNTSTGAGIYSEAVEDSKQKIDDAEIAYAILGHLVLLRIRPFKEKKYRFYLFNGKLSSVARVDSVGDSCAALPADQGLIFPDGFYLSTGILRMMGKSEHHRLERLIASPNGEDFLYVFHSPDTGEYVLMPYRLIEQRVEERISCHGFCLFPDGRMILFRNSGEEAQKHHTIQLRQTPFYQTAGEAPGDRGEYLFRVGNSDAVRCLAEIHEILSLSGREDPYAELYADLVRRCGDLTNAFPWLRQLPAGRGAGIPESLEALRLSADRAVDEFDNVLRIRKETEEATTALEKAVREAGDGVRRAAFASLEEFARLLGTLRSLGGQTAGLKEARYVELSRVTALETILSREQEELARRCVAFLLQPESLAPYRTKAGELQKRSESIQKVSEADLLEKEVSETAGGLETLVETLNSLPMEDATETTRILDAISAVYTLLNQTRAAIRSRRKDLGSLEAQAKFAASLRLLAQSTTSFLELCDTPQKCDEFFGRLGMQIQELEGSFAEHDEYLSELAEKREEITQAFDQKRTALLEARNKRAASIHTGAVRILKIIETRLASFSSSAEITAYLASDQLVTKLRESARQLLELEDPLRADDLTTRLKSAGQQAVRQLKDRQELFSEGENVLQIGAQKFNVNVQPLELTLVFREEVPFLHLTGTRFYEKVEDPEFLATESVWKQEVISENSDVYRGETLAWKFLLAASVSECEALGNKSLEEICADVAAFMANRYQEGYTRGVHDHDAALLIKELAELRVGLGACEFPPQARAMARVFWFVLVPEEKKSVWKKEILSIAGLRKTFPNENSARQLEQEMADAFRSFVAATGLFSVDYAQDAAAYLIRVLAAGEPHPQTQEAVALRSRLEERLKDSKGGGDFQAAIRSLEDFPLKRFGAILSWVDAIARELEGDSDFREETACAIFCGDGAVTIGVSTRKNLPGFRGSHGRIREGSYQLDYYAFVRRLADFERHVVPAYQSYLRSRHGLIERNLEWMRLGTFRPQVLTSFVRNRLINEVYFPLIGSNLAKQMGEAGETARTDRSGLLLLLSPPGYGKTTLLEYLASRLGIQYVKINGPALGFTTQSLDPAEAPNAAAKEELERLNFALEMGDNLMLCIDDIQHCCAEFLQKFISLCDAQRKIEGVWRGKSRTHDFRGKKIVVAMAGNPYTETGKKFQIPDMLSNRADTYNLGDIVGGNSEAFKASYLENAATSNPVLAIVANRSQKDVSVFLALAASGRKDAESASFEASYSSREIEETFSVLNKLLQVRDAILAVNQEYIRSAAQSDEFRTEPPFKLQGSYRNMNRLAAQVSAAHTDAEIRGLLLDHYQNESQTLTADTEANLLKLREIWGILAPDEQKRWEEIKRTFQRNQISGREEDPAARIAGQIRLVGAGFEKIQESLAGNLSKLDGSLVGGMDRVQTALRDGMTRLLEKREVAESGNRIRNIEHELEMLHATLAVVQDLAIQQREKLEAARQDLAQRAKQGVVEIDLTDEMLHNQQKFLDHFQSVMKSRKTGDQREDSAGS